MAALLQPVGKVVSTEKKQAGKAFCFGWVIREGSRIEDMEACWLQHGGIKKKYREEKEEGCYEGRRRKVPGIGYGKGWVGVAYA